MNTRRLLGSEGVLAGTWLLFAGVYGLVVFEVVVPKPWTGRRFSAWLMASYLAVFLVLMLLIVSVGYFWTGETSILGRLLGGLAVLYVPLHLASSIGLGANFGLLGQLAHYRQAFYPVLTVLAFALLIRAVVYRDPRNRNRSA